MDAIIIAGGVIRPGDIMYGFTNGRPKALIEIAGKSMVQWILDALNRAGQIDNLIIVGLTEGSLLHSDKPVYYLNGGKNLMDSILIGSYKVVELKPDSGYCLVVSADIPAITGEIVDWLITSAIEPGVDIFYSVIPRPVMEKRYPGSKRSYIRVKDITICGGDMHVINAQKAINDNVIWKRILESRKFLLRQLLILGFDILLRVIFKKPTLEEGTKLASRRLGINGRVITSPYAEIGMDADKPHQLQILENELKNRKY
jgi:molybdopterin-guanine dinucleotide biosynthesis protein A